MNCREKEREKRKQRLVALANGWPSSNTNYPRVCGAALPTCHWSSDKPLRDGHPGAPCPEVAATRCRRHSFAGPVCCPPARLRWRRPVSGPAQPNGEALSSRLWLGNPTLAPNIPGRRPFTACRPCMKLVASMMHGQPSISRGFWKDMCHLVIEGDEGNEVGDRISGVVLAGAYLVRL